ncbi:MAG: glycosyltransferase family 9 protein [Pseudomonadota bacterium]
MLEGEFKRVKTSFTNPLKAIPALRRGKHELIVDLTPWPNMTALCARLSTPITMGYSPDVNPGRKRLFDIVVNHTGSRHELENVAEMATHFNDDPYKMTIKRTDLVIPNGVDLSRIVLCHLSAGGSQAEDKSWPIAYWVELVKTLTEHGYQVGFTGVKSEEDRVLEVIEKAGMSAPNVISLCGLIKLDELAELLANVPLFITIDTGVLHLASAVHGRAIGLHGPTSPKRWGGLSPNSIGLQSPHPESGYMKYGFETDPGGPGATMRALLPETVIQAALNALSASKADTISTSTSA